MTLDRTTDLARANQGSISENYYAHETSDCLPFSPSNLQDEASSQSISKNIKLQLALDLSQVPKPNEFPTK